MNYDTVIILDCGGESSCATDTLKLVRKLGVFSEMRYLGETSAKLSQRNTKGFILTGDPVAETSFAKELNAPVLDIRGREIESDLVKSFLFDTCQCEANWSIDIFSTDIIRHVKDVIGGKKAVCGMSGGVDSSVSAVIVNKAIGADLTCIFVDTGLMRLNEGDEVVAAYRDMLGLNVIRVNAEDRFLARLSGITDPEQKRKIIGEEFIRVFEEEARRINADYLVQGTIYPDIIESGSKNKALVKSHHNVGGLPEHMEFTGIIEPVQELFKDEVREVGLKLGIPKQLINRQPFPGPGLGVRVIGEVTKEKLDILRQADFIVRDEIKKAGLADSIWQYFAILTGVESVGVKNDARTYGHVVAVRAIHSIDAMRAEWVRLPYDILDTISRSITSSIQQINRVVYDISSKPPSTIEWE